MSGTISEMIVLLVIGLVIAAICIVPASRRKSKTETGDSDREKDGSRPAAEESRKPSNRNRNKD
ncbi:MAG TPA: hypothetical protein PLO63_06495 [Syntrophales bacterium]|nr:hypothetical protein [Syntrophales bacterium]